MIITEKKNIVGTLLVQGREYGLLDLYPWKHNELPFLLRNDAFQFLAEVEGFANPVIVGKGSFVIIPYLEPVEIDVRYIVGGDEESEIEIPEDRMSIIV